MICNEIYDGQGLGNQLWNYVLARLIADHKHCDFSIIGTHKFKGKGFMELDFGVQLPGGESPEGGPPTKLPDGIEHYYREKKEVHCSLNIDISRTDENIFNIPLNTKFDGNCQSTKYLDGKKEKIKEWLKIKHEYQSIKPPDNICLIHLRCGDFYFQHQVFLQLSYYVNAINHIKSINPDVVFWCVTDQPDVAHQFLNGNVNLNVNIVGSSLNNRDTYAASHHYGGDVGVDFCLMMNAKYLIIPNSSFSWWAGYLSKAQIIIAPKYWAHFNVSDGYWSTSDIITDEFTYIDRNGHISLPEQCWIERKQYENNNKEIFKLI